MRRRADFPTQGIADFKRRNAGLLPNAAGDYATRLEAATGHLEEQLQIFGRTLCGQLSRIW